MTSGGVVVSLVDTVIRTAIARNASDIHFEPMDQGLRVRYRIDGVLYVQQEIDASLMLQIISRVKVLARINIAEKRVPQDGKFCIESKDRSVDLRVSTFPTIYGEKIVVRILDRSNTRIDLDQLGFHIDVLSQFHELINRSNGFFLVTGPTGSGKTTTLYAALSEIVTPQKNVVTLEDPVEYNLFGATQGQMHPESGFTFEKGMRAVLRQDPDVVMVGEMRDRQTARIGVEAALTGHVVLSTLHTNDAPGALLRLIDMGIEPFLVNAAVSGVLAQRLARTICISCCQKVTPTKQEQITLKKIGLETDVLYKGKGCNECFKLGYKGRTGIFELLVMSTRLQQIVVQKPLLDDLQNQARSEGMETLLDDAKRKLMDGFITLDELVRVIL